MSLEIDSRVLAVFRSAAACVPAYRTLLREAGIESERVKSLTDFQRLPVLTKKNTFQRFGLAELCVDGQLGRLGSVLTSSGHSGIFAFGLTSAESVADTVTWIDNSLDILFSVRSRPTLLVNCLPMGVKIPTQVCTLAETSVRADMAVGLVQAFGAHFSQIIFVGETAFIKHLLECGVRAGVDWKKYRVNVLVGEETLAENGRKYLEALLGLDLKRPEEGLICSSMGVAEVGLNLFFEIPPKAPLIALRRLLHDNDRLRRSVFGETTTVPSLFTYDPQRIFVECDETGRLILTTLAPGLRLPLVRYATGDRGRFLHIHSRLVTELMREGIDWEKLQSLPIVAIEGRGEHASAPGQKPVYPEAVKEGIYYDHHLAALTTANFRLVSGPSCVQVRVQLSPDIKPDAATTESFARAVRRYVDSPFELTCEAYEDFGSGMALDYERKFNYLGK